MHRLEHANLSVLDVEAMTRFLMTAFPHFRVRGEGQDSLGRPWRHVGDDECYVALQTVGDGAVRTPYASTPGLNHLGWEVGDLDALCARLGAGGFERNLLVTDHPARRRAYFHDPDGNDWEFVEYTTEDRRARNDYGR